MKVKKNSIEMTTNELSAIRTVLRHSEIDIRFGPDGSFVDTTATPSSDEPFPEDREEIQRAKRGLKLIQKIIDSADIVIELKI